MAIIAGVEKVLVASASASAASSIDITSGIDTTYDEYEIHCIGLTFSTDAQNVWVYPSSDGLVIPTYLSAGGGDRVSSTNCAGEGLQFHTQATSDMWMTYNIAPAYRMGSAADESMSGIYRCYSPASTGTYRKATGLFVYTNANGNIKAGSYFSGYDNTTDAVDSFRVFVGAGTILTGEVRVYGIVKSV